MDQEQLTQVRDAAIRLLARREHSELELRRKLLLRDYPRELIDVVIARLVADDLLSEERFTEAFIRARGTRGIGPQRIRAELQQRGIDPAMIDSHLHSVDEDWQARALEQYRKRFGDQPPRDMAERGKRYRFLINKGFTPDQVRRVLDDHT
jgi:regulatory protein